MCPEKTVRLGLRRGTSCRVKEMLMGRSAGGGGGGGFSGGGFSSGGFSGGGLSSGGFSGGHHSGGRSSSPSGGSSSGGGSHHGFGPSFFPSFVVVNNNSHNRGTGSGGSGGSGGGSDNSGCGGIGCGIVIALFALILLVSVFSACMDSYDTADSYSSSVAASTVEREALPASAVNETAYYTDADGDWIHNASQLESGLRHFYKKTGVQPYVYILPNGTTTSTSDLQSRAEKLYGELFTDDAHFILVFCDDGEGGYNCGYAVGSQAKTIMDSEAISILADYLDRYYSDFSLSEEEIFSKAFSDAADRIMTVTGSTARTTTKVLGGVAVVALIAGTVIIVVKKRDEQKKAEAKRTQDILNTPLEKFGSDEVEELAKKYQTDEEKSSKSS